MNTAPGMAKAMRLQELADFAPADGLIGHEGEGAGVVHFAGGPQEGGVGDAVKSAADADAANPYSLKLRNRQTNALQSHQNVYWAIHGAHQFPDVFFGR